MGNNNKYFNFAIKIIADVRKNLSKRLPVWGNLKTKDDVSSNQHEALCQISLSV